LSITVYPYKLTQRELEARLEPGLTVLPGQYLRFSSAEPGFGEPIFGQVREVRALPPSSPGLPGGYRLLIDLLYGTPNLSPQQVALLNAAQMGQEIQGLQEPIAQPLSLSPDFSAELNRLGALTVIAGDDFVQKYEALQLLIRAIHPHRRLVILDPLGVFAEENGLAVWRAGREVRLSLPAVGSKSFLDTFGELFAPGLREAALRIVADHLPPMQEFLGFQSLLDWYGSLSVPLKNLIVQNFYLVAQASVFADLPEQSLDWNRSATNAVTVLDLSTLQEPWRGLFFREAVQSLLEQSAEDVVPVLLYPENYLPNLSQWVQRADEAEFRLIMLASPYVDDALLAMANNRLFADSPEKISLNGSLTMGLPLVIPTLNTLGVNQASAQPAEDTRKSVPAPSAVAHPAGEEQEAHFGFSSFNVPLLELGVSGVTMDTESLASEFASEAEPPLHWLGEAADPTTWEPSESETGEMLSDSVETQDTQFHPDFIEFRHPAEGEALDTDETSPAEAPAEAKRDAAPLPPVVDLSSPQAEAVPEFLTASQLSQLLASSPSDEASDMEEELFCGKNNGPAPMSTRREGRNSAELAPKPQDIVAAGHSVSDNMPAELDWTTSQEDSVQGLQSAEEWASADHFPVPELEPKADMIWDQPQEASAPVAEKPESLPPPFPTPEEYEREEFHFDLNPDNVTAYESPAPSDTLRADAPSPVTQSLDEFAAFDFPVEPGFDANESDTIWDSGELESAAAQTRIAETGAEVLSGIDEMDTELDDTLDLIFPHYPTAGQQEARPDTAPSAPPVRDEPMVIVQKPAEPPVGGQEAFQAGDRVRHPNYGAGVVQKVIPTEESVVLNIVFDSVGKRLLDPSLCELSREAGV
jgi:hypothetical protein